MKSIPAVIRRQAEARPLADAVIDDDSRVTYGELEQAMLEVSRALINMGIGPGDRVALWAPNSTAWLTAYLGVLAAGAAVAPINTRFKGAEAAYIIERSDAAAVITVSGFRGADYCEMLSAQNLPGDRPIILLPGSEARDRAMSWPSFLGGGEYIDLGQAVARLEAIEPSSPAYILFTSGTTGKPKGAVITHEQNLTLAAKLVTHLDLTERDRVLAVIPLFHVFGLNVGFLIPAMTGAGTVLSSVFDPIGFMSTIEREHVALVPGPPTIFDGMLDSPSRAEFDLSSLRIGLVSATDVPQRLVERMLDETLVQSVITAYGLTEALVVSCSGLDDDPAHIAGFSGRVLDGVEVKVVAPDGSLSPAGQAGELWVRSSMVTAGYLNDEVATRAALNEDGWLRTGDLGIVTDDQWVRITGRTKDVFIVGGFNAYPAEIEEILGGHPEIREAAVVGMPDARLGEVGVAFIVPREGARVDADAIIDWSRARMANFKVPRCVEIVDALPKSASLKVDKTPLRARAAELAEGISHAAYS